MSKSETITIICPDCKNEYPLAKDTLYALEKIRVICNCGREQTARVDPVSGEIVITVMGI
jgi:hypothetical protein